jgi:ATP phosphoribosyltransferase
MSDIGLFQQIGVNMNKQQLEAILATLVRLEHKTKHSITNDEYWNIVSLCQAVEAPQFVTEYFATKANSVES